MSMASSVQSRLDPSLSSLSLSLTAGIPTPCLKALGALSKHPEVAMPLLACVSIGRAYGRDSAAPGVYTLV